MMRARTQQQRSEASITIETNAITVELGRRFELTVRRRWPSSHVVDDFDLGSITALRVKRRDARREQTGDQVVETIELYAWAFQSGKVQIDALEMRAVPREGGAVVVARSKALELEVRDLEASRTVELPAPPFPAPTRLPWAWILGAGGAIAVVGFFAWRRNQLARRRQPTPTERFLRELDALRANPPHDRAAAHEEARALSELLRGFVEYRYGIPATRQTTDEFLRSSRDANVLPASVRDALGEFLTVTDRVKFASHDPTSEERSAVHASVDAVYRASESERER